MGRLIASDSMPVIVIGADTDLGEAVLDALLPRESEIRAFVSSPEAADGLRRRGLKVALGDVSDGSHVSAAARDVFCAVLVATAARDARERSFAASEDAVLAAWEDAMREAGVRRVIWLDDGGAAGSSTAATETVRVDAAGRDPTTVATEVARLEGAARL